MNTSNLTHTRADFTDAIARELTKRATTYPKIIAKKRKAGEPEEQIQSLIEAQRGQVIRLQSILSIITDQVIAIDASTAHEYYLELQREMKMRKTYYPRLIYFKRITPEVAEQEKAVWAALVEWWYGVYLFEF